MAKYIRSLDPKRKAKPNNPFTPKPLAICHCPEAEEGEHECLAIEACEGRDFASLFPIQVSTRPVKYNEWGWRDFGGCEPPYATVYKRYRPTQSIQPKQTNPHLPSWEGGLADDQKHWEERGFRRRPGGYYG